jgi:cation:H+ antiporter
VTRALLSLLASGTLLIFAGSILTRAADAIAVRSGIGRLWIGAVLLAAATSLPELATDVSAVRMGAPDLAAGDLFGSSMANMLILALLGLLPPMGRVFRDVAANHALTACLAMVLNAGAGLFVLARVPSGYRPAGSEAALLVLGFISGMRLVYHQRPTAEAGAKVPEQGGAVLGLRAAVLRFGFAALVVLAVAPFFAASAQRIAELSGLGSTFVGTWLVGLATSLPELVTCFAAIRLGAADLAIGNLFGSNAFNMVIFAAMQVAHPGASIFSVLDPSHAITALLAVVLMALGLAAIVLRGQGRAKLLEPGSALMLLIYLGGLWLLYARTAADL